MLLHGRDDHTRALREERGGVADQPRAKRREHGLLPLGGSLDRGGVESVALYQPKPFMRDAEDFGPPREGGDFVPMLEGLPHELAASPASRAEDKKSHFLSSAD